MAKNEAKIKFTAETGEFNKSIKQANDEMSQMRAELKLNETQMKTTGASVEALEKQHSLLETQLKASENKTEALSQKVQKAVEIFGENSTEVTKLKTQLANAQSAEEKVRQAIAKCNQQLTEQKRAADEAESATAKLTDKIDEQQSEVDKLKQEYVEAVLQYGKTSKEAKDLAKQIKSLSGELADSKSDMAKATSAADKLDKSMDDAGDAARNSEDGFTVAKGAIADLASEAIQMAIGKVSEFIGWLKELPEATREIRQDFATLETSFESANFSTEQATDTWKELYKIFGEDDRAVEASNLIAKFADNQKDLSAWVEITKGVYGSYQDSLPVEGLAEAANETAKTGQVTGVLADALNWANTAGETYGITTKKNIDFTKLSNKELEKLSETERAAYEKKKALYEETEAYNKSVEEATTAEDYFNLALEKCTTEEERQALITETLTSLYGDAAKKYDEASGALTKEKEVAAETILIQNELAETVSPLTTEWQGLKNELTSGIIPAVSKVSEWGINALGWMQEHPVAMKVIGSVLGVVAAALSALIIVVTAYTVAQWAMNAAVLANPITWIIVGIVAAIAAIVAVIVLVIEYWDQISTAVQNAANSIWNAIKTAWDWICNLFSSIGNWINTNVIQPVVNFFTNLWQSVVNIWNNIVNAVKVAFMFIGSVIKAAFDIILTPYRFIWENCKQYVFAAFEWIKSKISQAVQAIKNIFSTVKNFFAEIWNGVKNIFAPVGQWFSEKFNSAKQGVQNAWSSVKGFFSNIWSGTKSVFSNVGSWFSQKFQSAKQGVQNAWSNVTGFFSNIISKIKDTFAKVTEKITKPFKTAIDKVKGFFDNLKLKFPNIKMPHFKITGKFSLDPPSVPKLSIEWYKKAMSSPMILSRPTIFGYSNGRYLGAGEAGDEMIGGTNTIMRMIQSAVDRSVRAYDIQSLTNAVEDLANRPIELNINGRQFALATAGDTDSVSGFRAKLVERGLSL